MSEIKPEQIAEEVARRLERRANRHARRENAKANHWYSQLTQAAGAACVVGSIGWLSGGAWALLAAGVTLLAGAALREAGLI